MELATLEYVIKNGDDKKNILLEKDSLFNVDKYTCEFKNEKDFINNYPNKEKIYNFIKMNNNREGHILVDYKNNTKENEIFPLFDAEDIFIYNNNSISDIDKAKDILLSSKSKTFINLLFDYNIFDNFFNNLIDISYDEFEFLNNSNFKAYFINGKYYTNYKSLFEYRLEVEKLGKIKKVYNRMINELIESIYNLEDDEYYFYNRQLRIIIDKCNLITNYISINNLKIKNIKNIKYSLKK